MRFWVTNGSRPEIWNSMGSHGSNSVNTQYDYVESIIDQYILSVSEHRSRQKKNEKKWEQWGTWLNIKFGDIWGIYIWGYRYPFKQIHMMYIAPWHQSTPPAPMIRASPRWIGGKRSRSGQRDWPNLPNSQLIDLLRNRGQTALRLQCMDDIETCDSDLHSEDASADLRSTLMPLRKFPAWT